MKSLAFPAIITAFLLLATTATFASDKKNSDHHSSDNHLKIGLVSSEGGFVFGGFNHLAFAGFERAAYSQEFYAESRESTDLEDIRTNIAYFVDEGFDLIITMGYQSQQLIVEAANQNPNIHFALIDSRPENGPDNLSSFVYQVDQAAFLSGFLAAWWATEQNNDSPLAGWVGGPPYEEIEKFRIGYESGVAFYNEVHNGRVEVRGEYTSGFMRPEEGYAIGKRLADEGASVIFPFAGITGYGALNAALERGMWAIGVDTDQVYSYPAMANQLLTSCIKNIDNTVYDLIQTFVQNGGWDGETVHYGTLENGDVDLAPFHYFEGNLTDELRQELETIRTGIINGAIATGWGQ